MYCEAKERYLLAGKELLRKIRTVEDRDVRLRVLGAGIQVLADHRASFCRWQCGLEGPRTKFVSPCVEDRRILWSSFQAALLAVAGQSVCMQVEVIDPWPHSFLSIDEALRTIDEGQFSHCIAS